MNKQKTNIFIPILILLLIFFVLIVNIIYSKYNETKTLNKLATGIKSSVVLSKLIHEMQIERGMSSGYVSSSGKFYKNELLFQRQKTQKIIDMLKDKKSKYLNILSTISKTRKDIDNCNISDIEVIQYYSNVNEKLLLGIFDIAKLANSFNIRGKIISYYNFLKLKENVGIQRAIGTSIIVHNKITLKYKLQYYETVVKQQIFKDKFFRTSSTKIHKYYNNNMNHDAVKQTKQICNKILNSSKNSKLDIDVNLWFNAISTKINLLKDIENYLTKNILASIQLELSNNNTAMLKSIVLIIFSIIIFIYMSFRIFNIIKHEIELIKINKQKDMQLLSQSRLAQMGEMISMIAHQWRQPLSAISANCIALNMKAQLNTCDKDVILKVTNKISDISQHLSSTIDDFRNFFKTNKNKNTTTCNQLVEDTISIVEVAIENQNIKLDISLNCNEQILIYENEVKQVLLNLIKNAEDVLVENNIKNPIITIKTIDKTIIVSDNGGGIPDIIISKIFDPYFSTKMKKDGTGLGLYMSKLIIEDHCNGLLTVSNIKENDNVGAEFKIIFKDI